MRSRFINIHTHRLVPGERAIRNILSDFHTLDPKGYFACGMHPWYITTETAEEQFAAMQKAAKNPLVLAIGECGLDKVCDTDFELQLTYFRKQIELAKSVNKPVIIHCVRAWEELISVSVSASVSKKIGWLSGPETPSPSPETSTPHTLPCFVIHGFNKSPALAARLIDAGFYLSFGKHILNPENACAEAFKQTPLDRVFFETDDAEIQIEEVYRSAALVKDMDIDVLCSKVEENLQRVFGTTF